LVGGRGAKSEQRRERVYTEGSEDTESTEKRKEKKKDNAEAQS
jgi:hypothetical protein